MECSKQCKIYEHYSFKMSRVILLCKKSYALYIVKSTYLIILRDQQSHQVTITIMHLCHTSIVLHTCKCKTLQQEYMDNTYTLAHLVIRTLWQACYWTTMAFPSMYHSDGFWDYLSTQIHNQPLWHQWTAALLYSKNNLDIQCILIILLVTKT